MGHLPKHFPCDALPSFFMFQADTSNRLSGTGSHWSTCLVMSKNSSQQLTMHKEGRVKHHLTVRLYVKGSFLFTDTCALLNNSVKKDLEHM